MGRWLQRDETQYLPSFGHPICDYQSVQDAYYLLKGIKRVFHDTDSGKYFFSRRVWQTGSDRDASIQRDGEGYACVFKRVKPTLTQYDGVCV